ncbi:hypothetical protein F4604DRAFT_1929077 [Suillus subluteus]|nr:hypothetical protein F4604DRAFT_1929077 [Suillus subluteus]
MIKRLAKLDDDEQKSLTHPLNESSYIFPNPVVSTVCNVQQLSTHTLAISDKVLEDWMSDSMGSYIFSSACPSEVTSLGSTCSSLHSLSDDGKELNLLDKPIYKTSTARQPPISATQTFPQTPTCGHCQEHSLIADSPPHLTGPTQRKQHSRTLMPLALPSPAGITHSPVSCKFIISPCSPPLKYRASPSLPQPETSEPVQWGSHDSCYRASLLLSPRGPPVSRKFVVLPCSPPLKYCVSPLMSESVQDGSKDSCHSACVEDGDQNFVPIQSAMVGNEEGVSITNHIYLMAANNPITPHDAGLAHISTEIKTVLSSVNVVPFVMDEIWKCIQQSEGYGLLSWQANLVKLEIPSECIGSLLEVMACASNERRLVCHNFLGVKYVMYMCVRQHMVHHFPPDILYYAKAERHSQQEALANTIDTAQLAYAEEAAHITETHGCSLKWTHSQLFLRTCMLHQQQCVNSWNTFVRAKLNEANEAYNAQVLEARKKKNQVAQANPKAILHDVNATFTSMDHEARILSFFRFKSNSFFIILQWMALCARTGAEGFYVAVRSNIEDLSEPKMFFTEKAKKFVKEVL